MRIILNILCLPIAVVIFLAIGVTMVAAIGIGTHFLALAGMWIIADPWRIFLAGVAAGVVLTVGTYRCNT